MRLRPPKSGLRLDRSQAVEHAAGQVVLTALEQPEVLTDPCLHCAAGKFEGLVEIGPGLGRMTEQPECMGLRVNHTDGAWGDSSTATRSSAADFRASPSRA